jgi:ATP-dependent Lhr-like helicase
MEESGRLRRGYFVAGLGATQFALPGALDLLRAMRDPSDEVEVAVMSATDPANPYGATLKWPGSSGPSAGLGRDTTASGAPGRPQDAASGGPQPATPWPGRGPTRSVGATVILVDGMLVGYLARGDRQLLTWLPDAEPQRSRAARAVARVLIDRARAGGEAPRGMLIEDIDGVPAPTHATAPFLAEAGFIAGAMGMQATFPRPRSAGPQRHTGDEVDISQ